MVDVIRIHAELSSEELGKSELDNRVLAIMREVPRHLFVPAPVAAAAYEDTPLPIGFNKTQGKTVEGMGLRRIRHTVELPDTPETRGMILKVRHLVEVAE